SRSRVNALPSSNTRTPSAGRGPSVGPLTRSANDALHTRQYCAAGSLKWWFWQNRPRTIGPSAVRAGLAASAGATSAGSPPKAGCDGYSTGGGGATGGGYSVGGGYVPGNAGRLAAPAGRSDADSADVSIRAPAPGTTPTSKRMR